jgi:hypothetical protein
LAQYSKVVVAAPSLVAAAAPSLVVVAAPSVGAAAELVAGAMYWSGMVPVVVYWWVVFPASGYRSALPELVYS